MNTSPGGGVSWRREKPERVNDPAIKRFVGHRALIALARLVTRGRSYEIFRVVSINRRLRRPFLAFNVRLMPYGKLPRRQTELVILRVAAVCESQYEWRQHVSIGRRAGLTDAEIELVAADPTADSFSHEDHTLLMATDELLDNREITDETWNELREFLDPARIFELCMLVGNYAMLAGTLNTFGVPLEPALRASLPARDLRSILWQHWDPIGVDGIPEAADEYDSYIGEILGILAKGASANRIAEHLAGKRHRSMGVGEPEPDERDHDAATRIYAAFAAPLAAD